MGAAKIIMILVMAVLVFNIVRRLVIGEIKVSSWRKGEITNDDGTKLRRSNSRSLWLSFVFLVIAMVIFLTSGQEGR